MLETFWELMKTRWEILNLYFPWILFIFGLFMIFKIYKIAKETNNKPLLKMIKIFFIVVCAIVLANLLTIFYWLVVNNLY